MKKLLGILGAIGLIATPAMLPVYVTQNKINLEGTVLIQNMEQNDSFKQLIKLKTFDINLNEITLIDLSNLKVIDLGEFKNIPTEDDILNQFVSLNSLNNKTDLQVTNITDTSAVISAKADSQNYTNEIQISFSIGKTDKGVASKIIAIYIGIAIIILLILGLFTLMAVKLKKRYENKQAIKNTKRRKQIMKEIEEESKKD